MLKILWHSNAPWAATGYGVQTDIFTHALKEAGHEIIISAFYGIAGATINAPGGFQVLPGYVDSFGNDIVTSHFTFTGSDLLITLVDAWVMKAEGLAEIPWAAWMPVDHYPAPDHVVESIVKKNGIPIAMSKFGKSALEEQGLKPYYVPHAVHPELLRPRDREEVRKHFGWSENFIVGMVAANKGHQPSRKCFAEVIVAFREFHKQHPEALLYLHTARDPSYGVDLPTLLKKHGVAEGSVLFANPYKYVVGLGYDFMGDLYAAMDVLANPSMGEGFGIPIIEAQSQGTPVIVSDWTAMPELCHFGKVVGGQLFYTVQDSFQIIPNVEEIYDAMEWAYNTPRESDAAQWIADNYSPQVVTERHWLPTLADIEEKLNDRKEENVHKLSED